MAGGVEVAPLRAPPLDCLFKWDTVTHHGNELPCCYINGALYVFIDRALELNGGEVAFNFQDCSVVILSSVEVEGNLSITATNVIVLSKIHSRRGTCHITAERKFIDLSGKITGLHGQIFASRDCRRLKIPIKLLRKIFDLFKEAIQSEELYPCADGFVKCYDGIVHPGREGDAVIPIRDVFKFFGIPRD